MRRVDSAIHPFWIRLIHMSTDSPKPGPHLHPSTRPATPAHTRPAAPAHTRLGNRFSITELEVGAPRQVGAKFAELAVDLDELADVRAGDVGRPALVILALNHLASARFYALLALDVEVGR